MSVVLIGVSMPVVLMAVSHQLQRRSGAVSR
jgi:hypothetical protein